jgi:hypothetical protein
MILFIIMIIVLFAFIKQSLIQKGGSSEEENVLRTHIIDNCLDNWKKGKSCPAPKCNMPENAPPLIEKCVPTTRIRDMKGTEKNSDYEVWVKQCSELPANSRCESGSEFPVGSGTRCEVVKDDNYGSCVPIKNIRAMENTERKEDYKVWKERCGRFFTRNCNDLKDEWPGPGGSQYRPKGHGGRCEVMKDEDLLTEKENQMAQISQKELTITNLKTSSPLPPVKFSISNINSSLSYGSKKIHTIPNITKENLKYIKLTGKWKDQGWGNRKGRLYITLTNIGNGDEHSIRVCNTNKDYTASHSWSNINFTIFDGKAFTYNETVPKVTNNDVPVLTPGTFRVTLEYVVGGGGGHRLYAENLSLEIQQYRQGDEPTSIDKEFKVISRSTPANDWGGGNSIYLDKHNVTCDDNGINSFRLTRPRANQLAYQYECLDGIGLPSTGKTTGANDWGNGDTNYLDRHNVDCNGKPISNFRLTRPKSNELSYQYGCIDYLGSQQCRELNTGWNQESSSNAYLDRHHVKCNKDEFLSQFRLSRDGNGNFRYNYKCCK